MCDFVDAPEGMNIWPRIAGKNAAYSTIDGHTTHRPGYDLRLKKNKRVEEIIGWLKTNGLMKTRPRRRARFG